MVLNALLDLVNELRLRIKTHGPQLRSNERLTRYALIDPLLRELGWDTSDPALVTPEIPASGGRADYALLYDGEPVVMVEAKKLGESLQSAVGQGLMYCLELGTEHFAVTDGQKWEIYETHGRGSIDDKKRVSFDVVKDAAGEVCLEALALWRPSVLEGNVRAGNEPVVGLPEEDISHLPLVSPLQSSEPEPAIGDSEWMPIGMLDFAKLLTNARGTPIAPVELMFPDGSLVDTRSWSNAATSVSKWLYDNSLLTETHCPIRKPGGRVQFAIAATPQHASGNPMRTVRVIGTLYMEADFSGRDLMSNAKAIIQHVGQDPSRFKLRFP